MLDIKRIREQPDIVKQAMKDKGETDTEVVDKVLEYDEEWRQAVKRADDLRNESKQRSKQIGGLKKEGKHEEAQKILDEVSEKKEELKELEQREKSLLNERDQLLLEIPNIAHESVPVGADESGNQVVHQWGDVEPVTENHPHWEWQRDDGWIDFTRGAKVTASGFPFYVGKIAQLQRNLINYFVDTALGKGYTELQVPFMVNEDSARGTGQIPDKEAMMYEIPRDEYYMIPTSEVPVTNFHRDEILTTDQLPIKYVCYSPCWRREAGSYGKDVKGLNRLHQFDKVELVKIVSPESSYDELESLRRDAEYLLEQLDLPYRTLLMCTGDMGFTQSKKYDLEVWSPAQERWLEVSSCSNFVDYQARRLKLRHKNKEGDKEFVHTLNGSGLALPRVMAALIEHYQNKDGSLRLPEVLQQRMGCEVI